MSWVSLGDHHRADVLIRRGLRLIKSDNATIYHWMTSKIVGTPYVLNIMNAVTQANITISNPPDWEIPLVGPEMRVCSSFEGCLVPLYECLFIRLGIRFHFSDFEVVVIDHKKISPRSSILELRLS